ncbi:MAG: hypothetical protein Q8N89_17110, partial [Azonexus sp.]|nr:hypothetical protein [Azonexus sp.]
QLLSCVIALEGCFDPLSFALSNVVGKGRCAALYRAASLGAPGWAIVPGSVMRPSYAHKVGAGETAS